MLWSFSWRSTAPVPTALASTSSLNGKERSGADKGGVQQSMLLRLSKACWLPSDQTKGFEGLVKVVSGAATEEKFLQSRQ